MTTGKTTAGKTTARVKHWRTADEIFDDWRNSVLSGERPRTFATGSGELADIGLAPGRVLLIGGAPAAGKTAFTMQVVVDALRLDVSLKATVCNVEMSPETLLDRQLARLSGIDLSVVQARQFDEQHGERLERAMSTIAEIGDRLNFVSSPYNLKNCTDAADDHGSDILILDYAQRIRPPGQHGDRRGAVDALMDYIRQFCDAGISVVVVSAVGRGRDSSGRSSYAASALSLASFRESSELEFGADDAYIIAPEEEDDRNTIVLKHVKARHREPQDVRLNFDGARQSFSPIETLTEWDPDAPDESAKPKAKKSKAKRGKSSSEPNPTEPAILARLKERWRKTNVAADDERDDDGGLND